MVMMIGMGMVMVMVYVTHSVRLIFMFTNICMYNMLSCHSILKIRNTHFVILMEV